MQLRWLIGIVVTGWAVTLPVFAEDYTANYVANEVLIKWKDTPVNIDTVSTVRVSDVATAVDLFSQNDQVEYVEPNYKRYLAAVPDDPYYYAQWYLEQTNDSDIDVETAWDTTTGSSAVVVAVIDTGMDLNHPDLVDNIWINPNEVADNGVDDDQNGYIDDVHGWDFVANDNDPSAQPSSGSFVTDYVLHGTHVAGTVGAGGNNTIGVAGVNWDVSIMPLKIFTDDGEGDTDAVAEAVAYAVANGADVINMSYGGSFSSQTEEQSMQDAADAGVILVGAAGNSSLDLNSIPFYPACYDGVIGVGATDDSDLITDFSNYGSDCVDVAAPGEFLWSTYYYDDTGTYSELQDDYGGYGYMSGTSMATPVVSGIAALVLAVDPGLSAVEVSDLIIGSADDIGDDTLGAGRVNAASSVQAALSVAAPESVAVSSFHSSSAVHTITSTHRTKDATPYFEWAEPASTAGIAGYYVYFGRERLNPLIDGTLQTNRNFVPTETLDGNERTYRLRIKAVDTGGRTSSLSQFLYLVDRQVERPTWQTIQAQANGGIILRWYKPKAEHVQAYKVYRSTERAGQYRSLSGTITRRKFVDTTAQAGQRYYYKVRAIDDLGNRSSLSKIKSIKL